MKFSPEERMKMRKQPIQRRFQNITEEQKEERREKSKEYQERYRQSRTEE